MKELASALVKAQAEMSSVTKDSKNPFFKSNYASLNAVRDVALPACNKYGITVLQPTVTVDGKQFVKTTLLHESGQALESFTEVIVKVSNDAQQAGSGISYARRYGLMAMLCLASDDDDGNSASGKAAPASQTTVATPQASNNSSAASQSKSKITFNKKASSEDSI